MGYGSGRSAATLRGAVLLVTLAACGQVDESTGTTAPMTASRAGSAAASATVDVDPSFPCDAWMQLDQLRDPDVATPEADEADIIALQDLMAHPSAHELEVDLDQLRFFVSSMIEVDELRSRMAQITSGDDVQQIQRELDQVLSTEPDRFEASADAFIRLFTTNEASLRAQASCEGAADPHFVLPCMTYAGFKNVLPPTEGAAPPPIEDEIQQRMEAPGFTGARIVHRQLESDPSGYELAALDDEGVASSLIEIAPGDGQWMQLVSYTCEVPSSSQQFTPVTAAP